MALANSCKVAKGGACAHPSLLLGKRECQVGVLSSPEDVPGFLISPATEGSASASNRRRKMRRLPRTARDHPLSASGRLWWQLAAAAASPPPPLSPTPPLPLDGRLPQPWISYSVGPTSSSCSRTRPPLRGRSPSSSPQASSTVAGPTWIVERWTHQPHSLCPPPPKAHQLERRNQQLEQELDGGRGRSLQYQVQAMQTGFISPIWLLGLPMAGNTRLCSFAAHSEHTARSVPKPALTGTSPKP